MKYSPSTPNCSSSRSVQEISLSPNFPHNSFPSCSSRSVCSTTSSQSVDVFENPPIICALAMDVVARIKTTPKVNIVIFFISMLVYHKKQLFSDAKQNRHLWRFCNGDRSLWVAPLALRHSGRSDKKLSWRWGLAEL